MNLDQLTPEAREKFTLLLARLKGRGDELRPYCTVRDPFEQARLWRQGVTARQVVERCEFLRSVGAPRIAACIESVGPQHGRRVTNAPPGYSWHQFGEAMDCFLVVHGAADWDAEAHGYKAYATEAAGLELTPGRKWGDSPHVQLRAHEPHHVHEVSRLDNMLAARFPLFAAL